MKNDAQNKLIWMDNTQLGKSCLTTCTRECKMYHTTRNTKFYKHKHTTTPVHTQLFFNGSSFFCSVWRSRNSHIPTHIGNCRI